MEPLYKSPKELPVLHNEIEKQMLDSIKSHGALMGKLHELSVVEKTFYSAIDLKTSGILTPEDKAHLVTRLKEIKDFFNNLMTNIK